MLYTNCTCAGYDVTARPGLCPSGCKMVYGFVSMITTASFVCTLGMMPSFIFTIRSVRDKQKSLALGLKTFLNATLGWLPAPVLYGKIVDSSCEVWSSNCKGQGACAMYDIEDFRVKRATYGIIFCFMIICLQWVLLGLARKKKNWSTGVALADIIPQPEVEDMIGNELNNID
ncbi:solute carrier organic anion transporter family member 2A1-like [Mizuhopecten yessoensis]|uniref:solute carrier organic anion transporter family member 2A1-like n=1 Tax=Mizuhopecten yessoensis TaxID=6573 RepID=UPI000B45BDA5|nr:solute carrier organic anion transporter family member 2A1-like [Mizuhopecten yessoensis]